MTSSRLQAMAAVAALVAIAGPWRWSEPIDALVGFVAGVVGLIVSWWLMPAVELVALSMSGTRLQAVRLWYVWLVRREAGWRVVVRRESTVGIVVIHDGEAVTDRDVARLGWSSLIGWITATVSGSLLLLVTIVGGIDDQLGSRWSLTTGVLLLLFQASRGLISHEGRTVAIWTAVRDQHRNLSTREEIAIALRWQHTSLNVRPRYWPGWLVDEIAATIAEGPPEDPAREPRYLNAAHFSLQRSLDTDDTAAGLALARSLTGEGVRTTWQASPIWPFIVAARSLLEVRAGTDPTEVRPLLAQIPAGSPARAWTPALITAADLMSRAGLAREATVLLRRERREIVHELGIWSGVDWLVELCDHALERVTALAEAQPPPAILPASAFGIMSVDEAPAVFAYGLMERSEWRFRTPYPGVSS